MIRRRLSSPDLDRREGEWWATYGELEERYCWALPDHLQPLARLRYLDRIAAALADHEVIVDYGCGTGWLSLKLAQRTRARVIGVDRFDSQIDRARANAARLGRSNVTFFSVQDLSRLPTAGAYLFHGLLHHLAGAEIDALFDAVAARKVGPADIVIVEPTVYPGVPTSDGQARLLAEAESLFGWRGIVARLSGSSVCAEEARQIAAIDGRWAGELPYGPSPKEKPFEDGELAGYLGQRFRVIEDMPVQCLGLSQRMASELALAELSVPWFVKLFGTTLRRRMDEVERRLLATGALPDRSWYMSLIHAQAA